MSLRANLTVLVLFVAFVVYPVWWATGPGNPHRAEIAAAKDCELKRDSRGRVAVVAVRVSVSRYPENWRHIVDARHGRNTGPDGRTVVDNGLAWPKVLTLNRPGKEARRRAAFRMSGLRERAGKARDEYPPAFLRSSDAADIRYVARDPNSAQGASMGGQLRRYCDGQLVKLVAVP